MSSAERRAREKEATREKILAAARTLFLEHGFEATSMRKIADAIDYTPAALYTHFADKNELVRALCGEDFDRLSAASQAAVRKAGSDPVEQLRAIGRAYVQFGLEHPHHYRFMFMTELPQIELTDQDRMEMNDPDKDGYALLKVILAECIAQGRFKPGYRDVEQVAQICWGAVHGVVALHLTKGDDCWIDWGNPTDTAFKLLDAVVIGMTMGEAGKASGGTRVAGRAKGGKERRR